MVLQDAGDGVLVLKIIECNDTMDDAQRGLASLMCFAMQTVMKNIHVHTFKY